MGYGKTKVVKALTTDGNEIDLVVPEDIPDEERAEWLRELVGLFHTPTQGHWKGVAYAVVPDSVAFDMADAMNFIGSLVDGTYEGPRRVNVAAEGEEANVVFVPAGSTLIFSLGYWHHGF
jgi:hypothetical protein